MQFNNTVAPDDIVGVLSALQRTRYKLLKVLYDYGGPIRYRDLIRETALGEGAFYTNLRQLMYYGFISQQDRGVFQLTYKGKKLVEAVESGKLWEAIRSTLQ